MSAHLKYDVTVSYILIKEIQWKEEDKPILRNIRREWSTCMKDVRKIAREGFDAIEVADGISMHKTRICSAEHYAMFYVADGLCLRTGDNRLPADKSLSVWKNLCQNKRT